jgi:hypothetical protein
LVGALCADLLPASAIRTQTNKIEKHRRGRKAKNNFAEFMVPLSSVYHDLMNEIWAILLMATTLSAAK